MSQAGSAHEAFTLPEVLVPLESLESRARRLKLCSSDQMCTSDIVSGFV